MTEPRGEPCFQWQEWHLCLTICCPVFRRGCEPISLCGHTEADFGLRCFQGLYEGKSFSSLLAYHFHIVLCYFLQCHIILLSLGHSFARLMSDAVQVVIMQSCAHRLTWVILGLNKLYRILNT